MVSTTLYEYECTHMLTSSSSIATLYKNQKKKKNKLNHTLSQETFLNYVPPRHTLPGINVTEKVLLGVLQTCSRIFNTWQTYG